MSNINMYPAVTDLDVLCMVAQRLYGDQGVVLVTVDNDGSVTTEAAEMKEFSHSPVDNTVLDDPSA